MPCCPPLLLGVGPRLRSFLRDYDALQSLALALIYLQVRIPPPLASPPAVGSALAPLGRLPGPHEIGLLLARVLAAAAAFSIRGVKPGYGIGFERAVIFPTVVVVPRFWVPQVLSSNTSC